MGRGAERIAAERRPAPDALREVTVFVEPGTIVSSQVPGADDTPASVPQAMLERELGAAGYRRVVEKNLAAVTLVPSGKVQPWIGASQCTDGCWLGASVQVLASGVMLDRITALSTETDASDAASELVAALGASPKLLAAAASLQELSRERMAASEKTATTADVPKIENTKIPRPSTSAQRATGSAPPASRSSVVIAVFDVDGTGSGFEPATISNLTTYLAARIAETGYKVVPRDQLRKELADQKAGSYAACVDESCQIELGKAVAAEKSLATKLIRIGNTCALTSTIYDLKTEATERAASVKTACADDALIDGIDKIVERLAVHE